MCCIQNLWYSSLPVSPRKTEKPFPSAFKSRQALQAIFFNLQWKCVDVPVSPISKSTPLVSAAPFFFEKYIIPQVRINKMLNKTYCWLPPKSFRINLNDTSSRTSVDSWGVYLQNISWIFSQTCISCHGCIKVANLWC